VRKKVFALFFSELTRYYFRLIMKYH